MWRTGERAKVSIFQVFRNAHQAGDAVKSHSESGDSLRHREGLSETTLREHLQTDLSALLNTIELGSAVDLEDAPHVRSSIINYGLRDLSSISAAEINTPQIKQTIGNSLADHEPRLVPGSIDVQVTEPEGDNRQRLSISVSAELMGDPVDIPLDFDAEVDVAGGKLRMSKLRLQV